MVSWRHESGKHGGWLFVYGLTGEGNISCRFGRMDVLDGVFTGQ